MKIYDNIPDWFLDCSGSELHEHSGGPFLIRLPGERSQKLFLSCLLHGNEHSGLTVIQKLLRKYTKQGTLPRDLLIFVGNTSAAKENKRRFENQVDFNRIWADEFADPEMQSLRDDVLKEVFANDSFFAAIDLHNNAGKNPNFGCISKLENPELYMASIFAPATVLFTSPATALSRVLSRKGSAITLECGQSLSQSGIDSAYKLVETVFELDSFDKISKIETQTVHQMMYSMSVLPETQIEFSSSKNESADLTLVDHLESFNYELLEPGTLLGWFTTEHVPLRLVDNDLNPVALDKYFEIADGTIIAKENVIPTMFTLDSDVITKDCLCYLMRKIN